MNSKSRNKFTQKYGEKHLTVAKPSKLRYQIQFWMFDKNK